jgi:glycosyltransferase involved in cell wall biosynthesis
LHAGHGGFHDDTPIARIDGVTRRDRGGFAPPRVDSTRRRMSLASSWRGVFARPAARTAPDVSICIPTWQSQAFIERTLRFALGQTHRNLRVLVSVDHGSDDTAAICRSVAADDPRLELFEQPERLGWARNVNVLLDAVRTETFFLYFHDDVIVPQYTERMLTALRDHPEAASAHCSMGHFGASDHVSEAGDYPAGTARRLAWFLSSPLRGSPLRSLTRSSVLARGVRLPTDAVDGLWANEPYLLRLLSAGPAVGVRETLYFRWDKRAGGLTEGWSRLPLEQAYAGYRANIDSLFAAIDAAPISEAERAALRFCVFVQVVPRIRRIESEHRVAAARALDQLHPAFGGLASSPPLGILGEEIASLLQRRHAELMAGETVAA